MRALVVGTMLLLATDLLGQTLPQLDLSHERDVFKKAGVGSGEAALLSFFKEGKSSRAEQPVVIAAARLLAEFPSAGSAKALLAYVATIEDDAVEDAVFRSLLAICVKDRAGESNDG